MGKMGSLGWVSGHLTEAPHATLQQADANI